MEYVKAGGKDRPFRLSYKAIKELSGIEAKNPKLAKQNNGLDYAEVQFFLGFKYGSLAEKQEVDFTQEDVVSWIDEDFSLMATLAGLIEKILPGEDAGKKRGG